MYFGALPISYNLTNADPAAALQGWIDFGVEAEQLGFWSVWATEHHYASDPDYRPFDVPESEFPATDYDMCADSLTLLTFLAAKTTTLRLGAGVAVPHWDHPLKLAERAAMLDVLSGGRLEFGIGRGAGVRETAVFGVPTDAAVNQRKFDESVDIIQKAWSGESFKHEGEFFSFPELAMTPVPGRPAPLYIGSGSLDSAASAARQGLPYATIVWPLLTIDAYKEKIEHYRGAAADAGVDVSDNRLPHFLYMHCAETDEEAQTVAFEHMMRLQYVLEAHYEVRRRNLGHDRLGATGGADISETLRRLAQFPVDQHLIGSPETIVERLRHLEEDLGLDYVVAIPGFGNMPQDISRRSMRLFAERVMPEFADAGANVAVESV